MTNPDIKEAVEKSALAVVGTGATISFSTINAWVTLCVGIVTFVYISVQFVFLLRKWRILEKHDWRKINTTPAPLNEEP